MDLSKELHEALCVQLNHECATAYFYRAMAAEFATDGLDGFAWWLRQQSMYESHHSWEFERYLLKRGVKPVYHDIKAPGLGDLSEADPAMIFDIIEKFEKKETEDLEALYDKAYGEAEHGVCKFLTRFILRQEEDEAEISRMIRRLAIAGPIGPGLLVLDRELKGRPNWWETLED